MTDLDAEPVPAESEPIGPERVSGVMTLGHRMADQLPELVLPWEAARVPDPALVILDDALAEELGLDSRVLESPEGVGVLAGNLVPRGAEPVALAYAGHQFGTYSPLLGDGRALLLGELTAADGSILDVHLKGSGRTPFARGGDGKATIGPMLREYLISGFLHRMGVPTTRSLAVVTTGEDIWRDGLEPGAVLTRIASSHIRVGTFEYAIRSGGTDLVRRLADHVIDRHHPHARDGSAPYVELLRSVVDVQALLIARWMTIGFIHGVMNTDNMTISGEGIDYGPCAFMDAYDPKTVFSSIDHGGRYAYGNQVRVAAWNLARLAETLLTLLDDDVDAAATMAGEIVNGFFDRFRVHWNAEMARKLGLGPVADGTAVATATAEQSVTDAIDPTTIDAMADRLVEVMAADRMDWTLTFREVAAALRQQAAAGSGEDADRTHPSAGVSSLGSGSVAGVVTSGPSDRGAFERWVREWADLIEGAGLDPLGVADRMDSVNPLHIPRNHLVDDALAAAASGDLSPFHELTHALSRPFDAEGLDDRFAQPAPAEFNTGYRTFCGT